VIQEERAIFWEVILLVIVIKKGPYEHVSNSKRLQTDRETERCLYLNIKCIMNGNKENN
jgi:hypothetical protein